MQHQVYVLVLPRYYLVCSGPVLSVYIRTTLVSARDGVSLQGKPMGSNSRSYSYSQPTHPPPDHLDLSTA
jgi:hypothetical protein